MRFVYVTRGPERENKQCADILLNYIPSLYYKIGNCVLCFLRSQH